MIAFGAAALPHGWPGVSPRAAANHATGHPRLSAARGAGVTAGEDVHTRHDERDAVSTGDLANTARVHEAHIPRGR